MNISPEVLTAMLSGTAAVLTVIFGFIIQMRSQGKVNKEQTDLLTTVHTNTNQRLSDALTQIKSLEAKVEVLLVARTAPPIADK